MPWMAMMAVQDYLVSMFTTMFYSTVSDVLPRDTKTPYVSEFFNVMISTMIELGKICKIYKVCKTAYTILCGALLNRSEVQHSNALYDESMATLPECTAKTYFSEIPRTQKDSTARFRDGRSCKVFLSRTWLSTSEPRLTTWYLSSGYSTPVGKQA